jgi:flagellar motor switch protein FliM
VNRQLSQQEIDAVFSQLKGGSETQAKKAVVFDFCRPDRIAKSQVRAIHLLHENFVRNLASSLAAYLRSYLTVNLISVEQLSYGEFVEGLPSPTCLVSSSLRPYDGNALIELNPALVFTILEIILGGKGRGTTRIQREMTEIEQNLLEVFFRIILNDLKEAWKSVTTIDFKLASMATEPQVVQILAPNEAVVAIGIEMRIGESSGAMNLAIPSINIKMIGQKFDQQWSLRKTEPTEHEQQRILGLIRESDLTLDANLSGLHLRVKDLLEIEQGDVLHFDYRVDRVVDCSVNGVQKYRGRVLDYHQKKAFQIEDLHPSR